jgi:hypothetical protein
MSQSPSKESPCATLLDSLSALLDAWENEKGMAERSSISERISNMLKYMTMSSFSETNGPFGFAAAANREEPVQAFSILSRAFLHCSRGMFFSYEEALGIKGEWDWYMGRLAGEDKPFGVFGGQGYACFDAIRVHYLHFPHHRPFIKALSRVLLDASYRASRNGFVFFDEYGFNLMKWLRLDSFPQQCVSYGVYEVPLAMILQLLHYLLLVDQCCGDFDRTRHLFRGMCLLLTTYMPELSGTHHLPFSPALFKRICLSDM